MALMVMGTEVEIVAQMDGEVSLIGKFNYFIFQHGK
jgi:hypothetical protein